MVSTHISVDCYLHICIFGFSQDLLTKAWRISSTLSAFYNNALVAAGEQEIQNNMKKILTVLVLLVLSVAVHAQKDVTKFLGIPVDGSKPDMIYKLKAKGFSYDSTSDLLEGQFNGSDVYVKVVTNGNKVYRIVVMDKNPTDESNIKIRFNNLRRQFLNNTKYKAAIDSERFIPDDENISYEIVVNKKRYEASFYQLPSDGNLTEDYSNKMVWFMIKEILYNQFSIILYYDNGYNQANGEDL